MGALLVLAAGWSVIGTVVVPRRVRSRLTRATSQVVGAVFQVLADRWRSYEYQDRVLAAQAPVQLILQIAVWLAVYELGFGLLVWPFLGSAGIGTALEQAGSALCTLGYVAPRNGAIAGLFDLAAFAGLSTVALQIGYLPTLYSAFNRRETMVSMLDSRAGVPSWGPELLARTHYGLGTGVSAVPELPKLFEAWEGWSADVAESHATYPPLVRFRSPQPLSSWLTAQLGVLDAAALYLSLLSNPTGAISARLCLRGGFTCLTTIARALGISVPDDPDPAEGIMLTYAEFEDAVARLRLVDFPIERPIEQAWLDFVGWRVNYEVAAYGIAWFIDAPPALWSGPRRRGTPPVPPQRPMTRRAGRMSDGAVPPPAPETELTE